MLRKTTTVICMLATASASFGSLWASPDWALTSEDSAGVGFDSNLYDRSGGEGDGYALIAPSLSLQRLNSFTNVKVSVGVQSYTYFHLQELDSLNPFLTVSVKYPYDQDVYPTEEFGLVASRTTVANAQVGGRLRREDLGADWDGNIVASEKTILQGRLDIREVDYLTPGFNDNQYAAGGLTLAYISNEHLDLGVGYDYRYSVSRPKEAGQVESDFNQHLVTFRGRGDFLPKLSGSFFVGAADTLYRGATSQDNIDVEGELDLIWQATERGKLTIKVSRQTYFSPNGYAYIPGSIGPEWTQEMTGGYSATFGVDVQQILYRFASTSRTDEARGAYLRLKYALTERFSMTFSADYTKQKSPEAIVNYQRTAFLANLDCKF